MNYVDVYREEYRRNFPRGGDASDHEMAVEIGIEAVVLTVRDEIARVIEATMVKAAIHTSTRDDVVLEVASRVREMQP